MAEDALEVLNREKENENVDSTQNSSPPSYSRPSDAQVEAEGGIAPISKQEQAQLSTGGNTTRMQMQELKAWKQMPPSPKKVVAREAWMQKYTGRSYEEFKKKNFIEQGMILQSHNTRPSWQEPGNVINALGDGAVNFAFDVIGHIPGGAAIDDWWDEHNTYKNDTLRGISEFGSLLIPGMYGGKMASNLLSKAPKFAQFLGVVGADVLVTGAADVSETDETLTSMAVKHFPNIVGPRGYIPVPEVLINTDADSPEVTRYRNQLEAAGIPVLGNALGFAFTRGGPLLKKGAGEFSDAYVATEKRIMGWMKPRDEAAKLYKSNEVAKAANPKKIIRLAEIDEIFASDLATAAEKRPLLKEKEQLLKDLDRWDNIEHFDTYHTKTIKNESKKAGISKMEADPNNLDFDPDITKDVVPDAANARQSIKPGNVAKNKVDIATNSMGLTKGDPTPIITESVVKKVLKAGGKARDISMDVAAKSLKAGDFESQVLGIRISRKLMNDAPYQLLVKYLNAPSAKALKKMFINKTNITDFGQGIKVATLGADESKAALAAYQILNDRYLGRPIAETSARIMETLGGEISSIAEATRTLRPFADRPHMFQVIREKMAVLYPEYRMTQHVWGVQGNVLKGNINNLNRSPRQVTNIVRDLQRAENQLHEKARQLTKTLEKLEKTNPELMDPLMTAYELSKGDVVTEVGLLEHAAKQVDPRGLIVSPEINGTRNNMNAFATATWSYVYNNVLSGLSTLRAVVGNGKELANKPLNALLGHAFQIPQKGFQFEEMKKMFYYYGAFAETNKRALTYMWETIKKVNNDPDAMMDVFRKDYAVKKTKEWDVLDGVAEHWRKEGDIGHLMQYDMAKMLDTFSRTRWSRFAMTGMSGVDAFTTSYMGTLHARMRAYDDVLTEHGKITRKHLQLAEERHYKGMFNNQGMLSDAAVKNATGEVALNLDSAVANTFNKGTTAMPILKPIMMFPRSGTNAVRLALSYTPIAGITGMDKYGKTIFAVTDDQIDIALKAHGLSLDTPNARTIFQNLKTEYQGRQVFSTMLVGGLWHYAMDGNIRGNGHYNGQRRINERRELGYEPLTVKLPNGKWVSYRGIPGVQQILATLGDLSYYSTDLEQAYMEDIHRKLMWSVAASFLNETPLGGLEPLVSLVGADMSGIDRLFGNTLRGGIPFSGGAGVLQNSIDSAQRDINRDVIEVVKKRVPVLANDLAYSRDIWTGDKINDIDNPWLRRMNAFLPIKVMDGPEEWREWLRGVGYRGLSKLTKDSTGKYEYNADEREAVYELIGKQQPWKKLIPLMKSEQYKFQTGQLRAHRVTGDDLKYDKMEIRNNLMPLHQEIDKILKDAQETAEAQLLKSRPDIMTSILYQRMVDKYVKQGRIDDARELAGNEEQKRKQQINTLLQMKK